MNQEFIKKDIKYRVIFNFYFFLFLFFYNCIYIYNDRVAVVVWLTRPLGRLDVETRWWIGYPPTLSTAGRGFESHPGHQHFENFLLGWLLPLCLPCWVSVCLLCLCVLVQKKYIRAIYILRELEKISLSTCLSASACLPD